MEKSLEKEVFSLAKQIVDQDKPAEEKLALVSEMLKGQVFHYDWVGFYILDCASNTLKLGPFAGKSTIHNEIPIGKGVCGQVALKKEAMVVQDVSKMENYLSCSIDVQSEIVIPILKNGKFIAEIDIDSHSPAPFDKTDLELLEKIGELLVSCFA